MIFDFLLHTFGVKCKNTKILRKNYDPNDEKCVLKQDFFQQNINRNTIPNY